MQETQSPSQTVTLIISRSRQLAGRQEVDELVRSNVKVQYILEVRRRGRQGDDRVGEEVRASVRKTSSNCHTHHQLLIRSSLLDSTSKCSTMNIYSCNKSRIIRLVTCSRTWTCREVPSVTPDTETLPQGRNIKVYI